MFNDLTNEFLNTLLPYVTNAVITLAPLWVPVVLVTIFWSVWIHYVRAKFFFGKKYTVLEIKLPKEITKSPRAMELFFAGSLHVTGGESTWYDKYVLGKTRPWFSLEIVSIEGQVKFFIWTRSEFTNIIQSGLYAQFPDIEIHEVSDYSKSVHFDPKEMKLWGCELEFTKPDPYPIKTYIDYGLDQNPKEEFKIDPITPLIEFLGSIGANQQIWIQMIVRAHKKEQRKPGTFFEVTDAWKDEAKAQIDEIRKKMVQDAGDNVKFPNATEAQKIAMLALDRSVEKLAFDVGIRTIYLGKKDAYNGINITGLTGSFKQFNSEILNGFKPRGDVWLPRFSYPWQDYKEMRQNSDRAGILEMYKRRSFFFPPYEGKALVMNTEELATIFHFPGSVVSTPTFNRIQSKRAEPPANLPI